MSSTGKWPDFRLASTLWSLVGSQPNGSEQEAPQHAENQPSTKDTVNRPRRDERDERDEPQRASPEAESATMNPDPQSIDELDGLEGQERDVEVEGGDSDVPDADFGTIEMFDSNATQPPYSSQVHSPADPDDNSPEASMATEEATGSARRSKRERRKKAASQEVASSQEESSRKHRKSKKKAALPTEIPDSLPTEDVARGETTQNGLNDNDAGDDKQHKRKRKSSETAEAKQRKKRKSHGPGAETGSQELGQDGQDPMDVDNIPAAQTGAGDKGLDKDAYEMSPPAQTDANPNTNTESAIASLALAAEAWGQHHNRTTEANVAPVPDMGAPTMEQEQVSAYEVPPSPTQEQNLTNSSQKRARSARGKKAKPTYFEKSPSPEVDNDAFAELPSPSALTPKPRKRAKRATKRKKTESEADMDVDEDGNPRPRNRMGEYTQGRFSEEELGRIARVVEKFRADHNMEQSQVNELIHAAGGTTAGDINAEFWIEVFATCPDRHRQKVINITRKKFHNFVARGTWTVEQDAELRDLIEIHGTKWSKIAAIINRHPEDLRDRYRNYIVCGDAQKKDAWDEEEEGRLTNFVMEAMAAIDELRTIQPSRELLKKPYEELIDWQNISEQMGRTRSRLQCITKWKALNIKTHGKDKLVSQQPDSQIGFRLERARRQLEEIPDEEVYRLVLAIHAASVAADSKIPWHKLVDKQFRNSWHRSTQALLWRRLKHQVPGWEQKTVRDCTQYLVDQYNQTGELPSVTSHDSFNDSQEMEWLSTLPSGAPNGNGRNGKPTSDEFVEGENELDDAAPVEVDQGVPDENINPDLPIEPMESVAAVAEMAQMSPVEPDEALAEPIEALAKAVEAEDETYEVPPEPAPPKATRTAKRSAGQGQAPRRSGADGRKSKRAAVEPSQDPIEDTDELAAQPAGADENNSDIDEKKHRKRRTPRKFRSAPTVNVDSDMDDMEDVPARV